MHFYLNIENAKFTIGCYSLTWIRWLVVCIRFKSTRITTFWKAKLNRKVGPTKKNGVTVHVTFKSEQIVFIIPGFALGSQ